MPGFLPPGQQRDEAVVIWSQREEAGAFHFIQAASFTTCLPFSSENALQVQTEGTIHEENPGSSSYIRTDSRRSTSPSPAGHHREAGYQGRWVGYQGSREENGQRHEKDDQESRGRFGQKAGRHHRQAGHQERWLRYQGSRERNRKRHTDGHQEGREQDRSENRPRRAEGRRQNQAKLNRFRGSLRGSARPDGSPGASGPADC